MRIIYHLIYMYSSYFVLLGSAYSVSVTVLDDEYELQRSQNRRYDIKSNTEYTCYKYCGDFFYRFNVYKLFVKKYVVFIISVVLYRVLTHSPVFYWTNIVQLSEEHIGTNLYSIMVLSSWDSRLFHRGIQYKQEAHGPHRYPKNWFQSINTLTQAMIIP